jgi:hypothetical protein
MSHLRSAIALVLLLTIVVLVDVPAHAAAIRPTNLLFTFLTNQSGFDSAVVISNTSADPLGTDPVSGACTLTFFGANARTSYSTGSIAAGTSFAALMSVVAPGFQGYVFAVCQFPFAHGIAVIEDIGARNLLSTYPALVVPQHRNRNGENLNE